MEVNMKRSFIKLCLAAAFVFCAGLSLCVPAFADIIVAPEDNFYKAHDNEMRYEQREYYSNGEIGYMPVYNRPGGRVIGYSQNGQVFFVTFTYTDPNGQEWGLMEYSKGDGCLQSSPYSGNMGYICLSDTIAVFDSRSFEEEHAQELEKYTGDRSELSGGAVMWTFPRSGIKLAEMGGEELDSISIEKTYTYPDGQTWGYCGYHYGYRNFWICLSDPTNTELAAEVPPIPDFIEPAGEMPSVGMSAQTLAIILVAAVAVITLAVILALKKRKGNAA